MLFAAKMGPPAKESWENPALMRYPALTEVIVELPVAKSKRLTDNNFCAHLAECVPTLLYTTSLPSYTIYFRRPSQLFVDAQGAAAHVHYTV